jgi:hypothetical protein
MYDKDCPLKFRVQLRIDQGPVLSCMNFATLLVCTCTKIKEQWWT